jgi:hypothetical protein
MVMWHVRFLAEGMKAATVAGQLWACDTFGSWHQEGMQPRWQDSYSHVAGLVPGTRNECSHGGRTAIVRWHVWFLAPGTNANRVAGQL